MEGLECGSGEDQVKRGKGMGLREGMRGGSVRIEGHMRGGMETLYSGTSL